MNRSDPHGKSLQAPGAYAPSDDRWGTFAALSGELPGPGVVLVDRRVATLHPRAAAALQRKKGLELIALKAGERTKSMRVLEAVLGKMVSLPRGASVVAVGGGTIGDLATVVAHLHKRGTRLVHVPTTLLAAVDSSLGGKGAVNLGAGAQAVKNAAGVFHYADAALICPEFFATLAPAQLREGAIEAWKMAVCLDARLFDAWRAAPPSVEALVRGARALKAAVCARDPYEREGLRRVLNFGHTFGHVIESVTRFRVRHGDAVGLGILCALDVGRALGVTPEAVAREVEDAFVAGAKIRGRAELARVFEAATDAQVSELLRADKKSERAGEVKMVLLSGVGAWEVHPVPRPAWRRLVVRWRRGVRP